MRSRAGIVATLALAGCAASADRLTNAEADELAQTFAGRTAGAPVDCVDVQPSSGRFRGIGGAIVLGDGGRLYRSDPVDGCRFLRGDPVIVVDVYGSRVCRNDRFRTIDRGASIPSADCRFGAFVPYERTR